MIGDRELAKPIAMETQNDQSNNSEILISSSA